MHVLIFKNYVSFNERQISNKPRTIHKRRISKCGTHWKYDYNKLQLNWNTYVTSIQIIKKLKNISGYGLYKTRYYSCNYLLLLGKRNLQSFAILYEKFLLLWNKRLPLLTAAAQSFKTK